MKAYYGCIFFIVFVGNLVWRGWRFKIMESQTGVTEEKASLRNRVLGRGRAQGGGRKSWSCRLVQQYSVLLF